MCFRISTQDSATSDTMLPCFFRAAVMLVVYPFSAMAATVRERNRGEQSAHARSEQNGATPQVTNGNRSMLATTPKARSRVSNTVRRTRTSGHWAAAHDGVQHMQGGANGGSVTTRRLDHLLNAQHMTTSHAQRTAAQRIKEHGA
jgi:hypothetical protein